MADDIEFSLTGLESLLGKLEAVAYDVKRKGGRSALRKAAAVVSKKVKEGAMRIDNSATPANISKNITLRWNGRLFRQSGNLGFRVGVLGGAKEFNNTHTRKGGRRGTYPTGGSSANPGGDTFYWRFVEFGTSKVAARPFMRPAMEQSMNEATKAFIDEYEKAIDRAIARAAQ